MNIQDAIHEGEWVRLKVCINGEPEGTIGKFERKEGEYFFLRVPGSFACLFHPLYLEKISIDEVLPNRPYEVIETLKNGPVAGTIVMYHAIHIGPKTALFRDVKNCTYAIPFANLKKFEQTPWPIM